MTLNFVVRSVTGAEAPAAIRVTPTRAVLGGFSARSAQERDRHIEELRRLGIQPPREMPAFWNVSPYLLVTDDEIQVQGDRTSGEIEYALIGHDGTTYVTVASDQTDRQLERHSIPRSKQVCPKVLGTSVVPLSDVIAGWDAIEVSSDVSSDGIRWDAYQRSPLAAMMDPPSLVRAAYGTDAVPDGTVLLSGTVPLLDGLTRFEPWFRGRLAIPGTPDELTISYRVEALPETVTKATAEVRA